MLLLDALIRYPAATLLVTLAILILRDGRHIQQARLGAYTGISISALLLVTAPEPLLPTGLSFGILRAIDTPNLVFLWLFGLSLFDDDFRLGRTEWAVTIAYTLLAGIWHLQFHQQLTLLPDWTAPILTVMSVGITAHLIWTALSGRSDDLIESRRRVRLWFSLGLALAAGVSITAEIVTGDGMAGLASILRAAFALALGIWAVLWLVQFHPERLLFQKLSRPQPATPAVDPKDAATHKRLTDIMETERVYTEQGLTIGKLASKLSVPEHQLRALINQGLGFRNFAAFLNSYRIGYAKTVLSDPEQARLPVLTIAMDAGYNSLAPFNRAFKAVEGITPTAFRSAALSNSDQS